MISSMNLTLWWLLVKASWPTKTRHSGYRLTTAWDMSLCTIHHRDRGMDVNVHNILTIIIAIFTVARLGVPNLRYNLGSWWEESFFFFFVMSRGIGPNGGKRLQLEEGFFVSRQIGNLFCENLTQSPKRPDHITFLTSVIFSLRLNL